MSTDQSGPPVEYPVPPLSHDVEVITDRWGVPHVYATTRQDAFVAQGFQAARDRLFQIDLWRRRGLGRLAEVLGPAYLDQDRATRLFLYRGDMRTEWLAYGTATRDIVSAFVAGVNAYVAWACQDPVNRLPPEFGVLGYRPASWAPQDVVRIRTHGLLYNAEQELARALTVRDLGVDAEGLRSVRESDAPLDVLDGLFDHLDDSVLDVYRLAFAPVDFGNATAAETSTPSGSNNWVIAPGLTTTGRPILANDPHRAVTVPSLRYMAHLEAPGLSVIGAGEPNLPGISIGHNQHVGFALTIWPVDHEDVYVYELHPEDDGRYLYRGAWEAFETVQETAAVAGRSEPVVHTMTYTRHGPVVWVDASARRAVAVRAVWLQPGMAPYLASLEYQDARNADEFRRALRRWGAPGVNQAFATTEGDIGWQASAMVPRRPGWDGALPVPGDGRYEWDGFAAVEELPSVQNPECGWFTSSNENNLPADYDNTALTTTTDWYTTGRHERVVAWLNGGDPLDVAASQRMHGNADNVHGRRLLDMLSAVKEPGPAEWNELQAWDGHESVDSFEALLYQIWQRRHLRPWLVDTCLQRLGAPRAAIDSARHRLLRNDTLFSDLRPDLRMIATFDQDDPADRELLRDGVGRTLTTALTDIEQRLGPDRTGWTWGALHRTELRHAVLAGATGIPPEWGTLPSVPRAGSGDTVGLTGHDDSFNAVMGSSFRMVLDVGDWDNSRAVNSPGQSGDPRSPHYADLLDLWATGDSFPLVYSRDAVEAAASGRVLLKATATNDERTVAP